MWGAGEGPADFAPCPLLISIWSRCSLDSPFGFHIFKDIQAKGRQAISSEPCTRSEIER